MSKFCEDCTWWNFTYDDGPRKFGTCQNMNVAESLRLSQDYDSIANDEPTIFTYGLFGCNEFEKEDRNGVVRIDLRGK